MNEIIAELEQMNLAVILPFFIIQLILMVIALVDWFKIEKTNGPKWMWLFIILLVNIIGPILYFMIGRRQE
ncbi:PLD nuclease N-terminal domain-containing protein [Alkalihalophilus lindianensis]|uniref:PLD nuclease N-terminal domain-containing protein n=1 Tax=Alkalihalophilus lindianensis TaxID=1630542 RepID=A0ABU3XDN8_9BACI|nr:PLD nuclease N-terminal domain-containing protein [Alkalihalophilus lindianensis]MDV2686005.1 PLD nuclease N-terminal domain-containing protein [Alkalihalophilus lindianensis]